VVASELEHLVLGIRSHQVGSRTNIGGVRSLGYEFQLKRVAAGCNSIGSFVICTIYSAVRSARLIVLTRGSIPLVASVTVRISGGLLAKYNKTLPCYRYLPALHVKPAPVRIDGNLSIFGRAATLSCARLPCHTRMGLSGFRTNKLATSQREKRCREYKRAIHDEFPAAGIILAFGMKGGMLYM
jgi:hypothetical protein